MKRRKFLQSLGGTAIVGAATSAKGAKFLDEAFLAAVFPNTPAVEQLKPEEARVAVQNALSRGKHVPKLEEALGRKGLKRAEQFARVYKPVSRLGRPKTVTIVPFHPTDPKEKVVGGLGVSEGEPASAVTVYLEGERVVRFTTHDVLGGNLVEKDFSVDEVRRGGPEKFVERTLPRGKLEPHLTVLVSSDLAEQTFRDLLAQEEKARFYTPAQVRGFLTNTPTVQLIAQLQYARLKGLTMSPDTSCCSCCCCCWGSCSSCSAMSAKYLSDKFYPNGITH